MAILISGVAGFVGSVLARHFIEAGHHVVGFDNLSRGTLENLAALRIHNRFYFEPVDLADAAALSDALARYQNQNRISEVWHMAANSDIPAGISDPAIDLRDTFMTTFNLLNAMRENEIGTLAFASSSAVYGDLGEAPIGEDAGPLLPISNYGAMKLASEAAISAAAESWLDRAFLFRFPNVIGVPATHGVILDFVRKLKVSPDNLDVLGSGQQKKSYLHVVDLIEAMLHIRQQAADKLAYFNIGPSDEGVTVQFIAQTVVAAFSPLAKISYGLEDRGWVGDVPRFAYRTAKLNNLGWQPALGSAQAVQRAVAEIVAQERVG